MCKDSVYLTHSNPCNIPVFERKCTWWAWSTLGWCRFGRFAACEPWKTCRCLASWRRLGIPLSLRPWWGRATSRETKFWSSGRRPWNLAIAAANVALVAVVRDAMEQQQLEQRVGLGRTSLQKVGTCRGGEHSFFKIVVGKFLQCCLKFYETLEFGLAQIQQLERSISVGGWKTPDVMQRKHLLNVVSTWSFLDFHNVHSDRTKAFGADKKHLEKRQNESTLSGENVRKTLWGQQELRDLHFPQKLKSYHSCRRHRYLWRQNLFITKTSNILID